MKFFKDISAYRQSIILVLTPIVASPLIFAHGSQAAKCAFCVVIMAIYWMCETLPLAVTALIPMVLYPLLGVMKSKQIATTYLPDTNFLFMGGLIVAVAVEKCNLHQRVALKVLTIVGSQPKWIMFGFMLVTAFLSMWISNTATTAMMVPIAQSVIEELIKGGRQERRESLQNDAEMTLISEEEQEKIPEKSEGSDPGKMSGQELSIAKGLMICICFAANIGGTGTITGTPPNLVFIGQLERLYPGADTGINFLSWMAFSIPSMLVALILSWLCLCLFFLRSAPPANENVTRLMQRKYHALPSMHFAELSVLVCFALLLLMWIFRDPKVIPGFGAFFMPGYVTDATSAMIISLLLFALPNEKPDFLCSKSRDKSCSPNLRGTLMDWRAMQEKFPWSVVFLLGGGFALAAGVKESGLSLIIGSMLEQLGGLPLILIQLACVLVTMIVTNICSNTVTASIFIPIVAGLAERLRINPLNLMLPVTLACSFAFTLPVATPPNAIVFASGMLRVSDLMKSGLVLTILSAIVIVLNMVTYAQLLLPLDEFLDWEQHNATFSV